jgi:hypothetical protein
MNLNHNQKATKGGSKMKNNIEERKPPKDRKHPQLWQAYLWWSEIVTAKVRHTNRLWAINEGLSNMDPAVEDAIFESMNYDGLKKNAEKMMGEYGKLLGPVWEWTKNIRGISNSLAGQLLAQIDDIELSPTVSALWRYCGLAVIDGKAEGKDSRSYNRRLKATCWNIAQSFVKMQTSPYIEIYYEEKARLRTLHPERIKVKNKQGKEVWRYNDGHIARMAERKMIKIFLQHLWVRWREQEGLPVSKPYVIDIMGHAKYIEAA